MVGGENGSLTATAHPLRGGALPQENLLLSPTGAVTVSQGGCKEKGGRAGAWPGLTALRLKRQGTMGWEEAALPSRSATRSGAKSMGIMALRVGSRARVLRKHLLRSF